MMRTKRFQQRTALVAVFVYLFSFMAMPAANAEMIGTQTMLDHAERADRVERVQTLLSQERIEKQMVALGVDPAHAKARVSQLTNSELARLEGNLESLPAGGDALAVLGIVFLVLLVLELVGATNLFNRI